MKANAVTTTKIDTRYSHIDTERFAVRSKTTELKAVKSISPEPEPWSITRGAVHGAGECEPFAHNNDTGAEAWIDAAGELRGGAPRNMPGSVRIPRWVLEELFEHERQRKMRSTRQPPAFTVGST